MASPAGGAHFEVALTGVVVSAIQINVRMPGVTSAGGPTLEVGNLSTLAPVAAPLSRERLSDGTRFSFPVEVDVLQSGLSCSTLTARLADPERAPLVDLVLGDAPATPLGADPRAVARVTATHTVLEGTGRVTIPDTREPGPLGVRLIFEATARCDSGGLVPAPSFASTRR